MKNNSELNELMKLQKSSSLFSKKTSSISRLKLSFFEKMKAFEEKEDLEKTHLYFTYLIRASNLSDRIYRSMYNELNDTLDKLAFENNTVKSNNPQLDSNLNSLNHELER